ncbi:hypothetical protein CF65_01364 [Aggregatibacter actinomycetemcomitans HK1651]|nr:hypothetical protein CF65_01364 [Aggregatibacter actinomycetemcomitans HK1651]
MQKILFSPNLNMDFSLLFMRKRVKSTGFLSIYTEKKVSLTLI